MDKCQVPGCYKPGVKRCGWPIGDGSICAKKLCYGHSKRGVKKNLDYCPKHWREKSQNVRKALGSKPPTL